jgi:glucan phosphoethanolaminetransferase (alkaline phosphatase superfamily)
MRPPLFDPHRMLAWTPAVGQSLRLALRWGAHHTGLPIVLVAAITMVVSWRLFRRSLRFVVEVVVAVALLAVAARFGWITW